MRKAITFMHIRAYACICTVLVLGALPLFAQTDDAAQARARTLWGDLSLIGSLRDPIQSNWTKLLWFKSFGCKERITLIAEGFNAYDAAFDKAKMMPPVIAGPFKGAVSVLFVAHDNVDVTRVQAWIDGGFLTVEATPTDGKASLDTSKLKNGTHVFCWRAFDEAGNMGATDAKAFRTDQTAVTSPAEWRPGKPLPVFMGVKLAWDAPAEPAASYDVWRAETSRRDKDRVGHLVTGTTFTDMSAIPGKVYFYGVSAVSPAGAESAESNELRVLVAPMPDTLPPSID